MSLHLGRLLDHVHLVVSDLEKSRIFFKKILKAINRELTNDDVDDFGSDELFFTQVDDNSKLTHIHIAFQVPNREFVDKFYAAGIKAGGVCNGKPGERNYHPGYYAAFILDPDGNNIEAVHHGEADRSAESIVLTPK